MSCRIREGLVAARCAAMLTVSVDSDRVDRVAVVGGRVGVPVWWGAWPVGPGALAGGAGR